MLIWPILLSVWRLHKGCRTYSLSQLKFRGWATEQLCISFLCLHMCKAGEQSEEHLIQIIIKKWLSLFCTYQIILLILGVVWHLCDLHRSLEEIIVLDVNFGLTWEMETFVSATRGLSWQTHDVVSWSVGMYLVIHVNTVLPFARLHVHRTLFRLDCSQVEGDMLFDSLYCEGLLVHMYFLDEKCVLIFKTDNNKNVVS